MFPDRLCSFLDSYLSLPQRQPIEVDIYSGFFGQYLLN